MYNRKPDFDSLIVVDDNGKEVHIEFRTRYRINRKTTKDMKRMERLADKLGRLQRNESFIEDNDYVYMGSIDGDEDNIGVSLAILRKKDRLIRKALKYQSKKNGWNETYDIATVLSRSTHEKLKKELSKYGKCTIKSKPGKYDIGSTTKISAHDENVYRHLYLYNSISGEKVNVQDFISISLMLCDKNPSMRGFIYVDTNKTMNNLNIALKIDKEVSINFIFGLGLIMC